MDLLTDFFVMMGVGNKSLYSFAQQNWFFSIHMLMCTIMLPSFLIIPLYILY